MDSENSAYMSISYDQIPFYDYVKLAKLTFYARFVIGFAHFLWPNKTNETRINGSFALFYSINKVRE